MTTSLLLPLILLSSLSLAQQGDGGAASGNIPASSQTSGDIAGAAGSSTGIVRLSTGAIVGIAIVVAVASIIGISTATLFFQAKKRQWTVRETLRRSTRRVTTGLKSAMAPLTPHRTTFGSPRFPKVQKQGRVRNIGFDVDMERLNGSGDLEKGARVGIVMSEKRKDGVGRPKMPQVVIPDVNVGEDKSVPKTPMFKKVFGRD